MTPTVPWWQDRTTIALLCVCVAAITLRHAGLDPHDIFIIVAGLIGLKGRNVTDTQVTIAGKVP